MSFASLRRDFFEGYLARHPEEAFTLGRYEGAGRLRNHGADALEEERRWYQAMAARLEAASPATDDERIDHRVMTRVVAHHLRDWDRLWCGIDWSTYPAMMSAVQWVHAESDDEFRALAARLTEVPRFLEQHQARVLAGRHQGIEVDGALCGFIADHQLPPAEGFLRDTVAPHPLVGEAAVIAADAYAAHRRWLAEEIAPHATDAAPRLGDAEVRWRLREGLGLSDDVDAQLREARVELEGVQERMLRCAAKVDPTVRSREAMRALTDRMQEETIATDADAVPAFRALVDRTVRHVREHGAYRLPDDYRMGVAALPPGFSAASVAGNWPAPLLDGSKLGHFMVAAEAQAHRVAWSADLAVHEGAPGHHLQSFWWQRHHGGADAPVRFLLVHDHVAVPRNYWGAMPNIEGYAVYAEELMRRQGFFSAAEELFVLMAHAVRAARVVVDLSLHTDRMTEEDARAFLRREVGMTPSQAAMEVRRYLQIPLQGSTYLLGRLAIEALKDDVRAAEGQAFDEASFHERFFAYGPADPTSIREAWLGSTPAPITTA